MKPFESLTIAEIRERYLGSLSPVERMDYELACAREARLVAERAQESCETRRLLARIEARAGEYPGDLLLSAKQVKLLAAELRRLQFLSASSGDGGGARGGVASPPAGPAARLSSEDRQ